MYFVVFIKGAENFQILKTSKIFSCIFPPSSMHTTLVRPIFFLDPSAPLRIQEGSLLSLAKLSI